MTLPYAADAPQVLEPYRLDEPLAVRGCLRALRDRCARLMLHGLPGLDEPMPARLVAVNAPIDRIELDVDAHAGALDALPPQVRAEVVGFVDQVKLQFTAESLRCVPAASGQRLQALLPGSIHRRQRRATFRVRPVAGPPARCRVPAGAHPGHGDWEVLDASIGGVSLRWCSAALPAVGQRIEDCVISLPAVAPFRCDLIVRSVEPAAARVGCEFSALSGPLQRSMQRFVFDTDRRWLRARAARPGPDRA